MSSTLQSSLLADEEIPIASMKTNSARVILEAFGESITQLKASGSTVTSTEASIEELREYGVIRKQETKQQLDVDYRQPDIPDGPTPENQWDPDAIEEFFGHVNAILDTESQAVKPDLAVQSFTIRITDEALQSVTPARTNEFELYFEAAPAEQAVRRRTRRANAGRGLYSELGFNVTNLNLHSVIESAPKFSGQSDCKYYSWQGPEYDVRPNINPQLSVRINDRVLPDEYGMLKPYHIVTDEVIDVPEDAFEDIESSEESADEEVDR